MTGPGRRAVLRAGAVGVVGAVTGAGLVQADVLPGRVRMWQTVEPLLPGATPSAAPGPVRVTTLPTAHLPAGRTRLLVAAPPGTDLDRPGGLPIALVLHGRGGSVDDVRLLAMPGFLADVVAAGAPPFGLAAVDGGDVYWHPRADGRDPQALLLDDVLPRLAADGWGTGPGRRIGVYGWSMGGYGALLLAQTATSAQVAVTVASSPSLWPGFAQSRPGAFDDAADFARHDVFAGIGRLAGVAVRVDCGLGDVFLPQARRLVRAVDPHPAGSFGPGGHDVRFWRARLPGQLAFIGRRLAG